MSVSSFTEDLWHSAGRQSYQLTEYAKMLCCTQVSIENRPNRSKGHTYSTILTENASVFKEKKKTMDSLLVTRKPPRWYNNGENQPSSADIIEYRICIYFYFLASKQKS